MIQSENIPTQSTELNHLLLALSKAQGELTPAIKESPNFYKGKYANLPACINACKEVLAKNGLSIVQTTDERNGKNVLITLLGHSSGQFIRSFTPLVIDKGKEGIHGLGSSITYFRRYALCAIIGLCQDDDDDDGNKASNPNNSREKAQAAVDPVDNPKINAAQVTILSTLLDKMPEFRSNVMDWLRKTGINTIANLHIETFDTIMADAKRNFESIQVAKKVNT